MILSVECGKHKESKVVLVVVFIAPSHSCSYAVRSLVNTKLYNH